MQRPENLFILSSGFAATFLTLNYLNPAAQTRTLALQTAPDDKPEDCRTLLFMLDISLKELEALANCNVVKLKNNAKQIILDRVMAEKNLAYLLECAQSSDPATRKRSFIVFHQLADQERNCHILVKKKALKFLARSLKSDQDIHTHKFAVATLYKLVAENGIKWPYI
jgi:response regulator RpfG family c-di-GMP phosphodiesterase